MDQVVELGERLDTGVPRADEDEAELTCRSGGVGRRVGDLQPAQDVISERDRVGEILEAHAVLGEARHGKGARDRSEGDDEALVADVDLTELARDPNDTGVLVECQDVAQQQLGVPAHLA